MGANLADLPLIILMLFKRQKRVGKMASSRAKEVHTSIKKNIILLTLLFEFLELVEMVLLSRMDGMCLLVEQANS